MAALTTQQVAMWLPTVATPAHYTKATLTFAAVSVVVFAFSAWCCAHRSLKTFGRVSARVARHAGLAVPTVPGATSHRRSARTLVLLLAGIIMLDYAGSQLIMHALGGQLSLVPLHEDWRYLAVRDATPAVVVVSTLLGAPVPEEVIFRGSTLLLIAFVHRSSHLRQWHPLIIMGIVISIIVLFASIHLPSGTLNVATTAWSGTLYTFAALLTRSLLLPIAAHFAYNLSAFGQWLDWWDL